MPSDVFVEEVAEFPEGERRIIEVNGREIGVFNLKGKFYALLNVCLHQSGPMLKGTITGTLIAGENTIWMPQWIKEGEILRCPWHFLEFDIRTGDCLGYPGRRIRFYEVRVVDGKVILAI